MTDFNQNFTVYSGKVRPVQITITDSQGVPLDITGNTFNWAASRLALNGCYSSIASITKSTGDSSITVIDALNGVIEFTLQ